MSNWSRHEIAAPSEALPGEVVWFQGGSFVAGPLLHGDGTGNLPVCNVDSGAFLWFPFATAEEAKEASTPPGTTNPGGRLYATPLRID